MFKNQEDLDYEDILEKIAITRSLPYKILFPVQPDKI